MYVLQATGPYVIDDSRSLLYASHREQLRHTRQGSGWRPTRLITLEGSHTVWIGRGRDLPDLLYTGNFSFVASERFMEAGRVHEHRGLQYWEVDLAGRLRGPRPRYYLVNVYACVDAVNLTAMSAEPASVEYPDPAFLVVPQRSSIYDPKKRPRWILDPVRAKSASEVFVAARFEDIFVRSEVAARLRKASLKGVYLQPVLFRREPVASRRLLLAAVLAECRRRKHRRALLDSMTVTGLARSLALKLPRTLVALLRGLASITRCRVETLSPGEMLEATNSMRAHPRLKWNPDLIVIAKDGRGGMWAVDTSSDDGMVLYIDHELIHAAHRSKPMTPTYEIAAPSLQRWTDRLARGGDGLPPVAPSATSAAQAAPRESSRSSRTTPTVK